MPAGKIALRLVLCGCLIAAAGANWPRFRGPNGTGTAADKDVPVSWNEQSGILWKVPLPGLGNSSPVIWGDRLFVQTSTSDARQRLLLCLSVTDGKVLWSRPFLGGPARKHPKNTFASATPATDGERVYAAFWDGKKITMMACDMDGRPVWQKDLGAFESQHGPGTSPIIYRDKVIYPNDQDDKAELVALDSRTGAVAWRVPRPGYRACYSSPFIREEPGASPELVVVSTMEVTGYNPETGEKHWTWNWKFTSKMPLRTTGSPIYAHGTLFACSGDGGGDRHMVAVQLEGHGKHTKATQIWENKKDFPYVPTMLSRGEHLYFVNDRGLAGCYLARTGERVWFERLPGASFISSPVLIDGKIYAASEEGDVFVLAAEPTFQLLARNSLGEQVRASLAVADNRLFIRGQQHLFCIGKTQGR